MDEPNPEGDSIAPEVIGIPLALIVTIFLTMSFPPGGLLLAAISGPFIGWVFHRSLKWALIDGVIVFGLYACVAFTWLAIACSHATEWHLRGLSRRYAACFFRARRSF